MNKILLCIQNKLHKIKSETVSLTNTTDTSSKCSKISLQCSTMELKFDLANASTNSLESDSNIHFVILHCRTQSNVSLKLHASASRTCLVLLHVLLLARRNLPLSSRTIHQVPILPFSPSCIHVNFNPALRRCAPGPSMPMTSYCVNFINLTSPFPVYNQIKCHCLDSKHRSVNLVPYPSISPQPQTPTYDSH